MTPERWLQIERVLQGALDRPAQDRASFVADSCSGDHQLMIEAQSLVAAHERAVDFMEEPAIASDAAILLDSFKDYVDTEIGPYSIVERLGAGGMGEVYLARDTRLDRFVALKILPSYFAAEDSRLNRFQREARAASALNHPNILTIHEVGEHDGIPFIATEYIDGVTVRHLIENDNLAVDDVIDIGEQIASALTVAHAAGIVHRDIKPENIMRRSDGLVKILDFGIAKLAETQSVNSGTRQQTEIGVVMGTVDYMSPEQARGLAVDERTDIWSLGVVLYEMLAHRLPFSGPTRMDSMVAILEREPAAISETDDTHQLMDELQSIVLKCLQKNPSLRYQSATELLADLKNVRQLESRAWTKQTKPMPVKRRSSWLLMSVGLLVVVLFGVFLFQQAKKFQTVTTPTAATTPKLYSEMNEEQQLAFVREQEQRISKLMGDRPAQLSEEAVRAIKSKVDRYTKRKPEAEPLNDVYNRAPQYVPTIARAFASRKAPVIIGIYLPMVESAYRPCYENEIGAKGLFQFIPQTARHYGVPQSDMCDVDKMTAAAAQYIADLMAELGEDAQSLTLVLVSYNRGSESVRDTLRDLRGTDNYQRNFWTLFAQREKLDETFKKESAWYVPTFFAAAIIGENPQRFGLTTPPLSSLANDETVTH